MTPYQAYISYLSIRLHFTNPKYSFFRYNGKVRARPADYEKRVDKMYFRKLANHYDPVWLLVSNLMENPNLWVGDICKHGNDAFTERRKVVEGLTHFFTRDLEQIPDLAESLRYTPPNHPGLVKLYLAKKINIETAAIIVNLSGCGDRWLKNENDTLLQEVLHKLNKYYEFLDIDESKFAKILVDKHDQTIKSTELTNNHKQQQQQNNKTDGKFSRHPQA